MKNKKSNNKKNKLFKDIRTYLMILLIGSALFFIYQIWKLDALPIKYFLPIVIIMVIVILLLIFLQYKKHISKLNKNLGKVLIILMTILLIFGNVYAFQALSALNGISVNENDVEYDVISVVVKKDNKAEELKDVRNATFALNEIDEKLSKKTVTEINKELDKKIKTKDYKGTVSQANALYDGEVEAIILNEAYRSLLDEEHPAFNTETKIIYTYKIPKKVKKLGKAVDVNKEPYNVYISGLDTYGEISTQSRSDVNIIATINPNTKQILLTSIPRDYYVAQTCQGNQKDKLTHSGIFGVSCTVDSMENFMDLTMNYYVRVNFSSLESIVDSLGGVDIYNETAFNSGVDGTYIPAGNIHLNGETALKFSRERHAYADGDRQRGRNQMIVINAIINKAVSPAILSSYSSIMSTISSYVQTNMESTDMTSIVKKQLSDNSGWEVLQQSVTGSGGTDWTPANGFNAYVMYPDQESVNKALANINSILKDKKIEINE